MKNTKTKWIGGLGLLGLGVVLLSFGHAGDEPKFTRYEVIRSVNGEVTTYDTVVASGSAFTPEQYLAQLGFSADANIEIISVPHPHEMMMFHHRDMMHPCGDSLRMVTIEMEGMDPQMMQQHMIMMHHPGGAGFGDSTMMIELNIDKEHAEMMDQHHQMMIEKNIMIKSIDSLNHELVEVQRLIELVNLDSLIALHELHGDSAMVFMHEIVIEDGGDGTDQLTIEQHQVHGDPTFERHVQDGNTQSDIQVFGGKEDFTIVIVSDASAAPKSEVKIEKTNAPAGNLKLYPNPASKEVTVQLNFDEKATTHITVTNSEGKVMMQLSLGEFSGQHVETINVSKWSKGIYFVNVERPGTKTVEKLVIE
jgi:hypothetical protein